MKEGAPQISRQQIAAKTTELINDHAGRQAWETVEEDKVLCFYLGGESLELIAFEQKIEAWLVDEHGLPTLTQHVVHGEKTVRNLREEIANYFWLNHFDVID